ncbi:aldo/keto reductase [Arcanobacterium haemolyticum]|nr:aldo/keto reductase [Arcanobacterium haemolyticum]
MATNTSALASSGIELSRITLGGNTFGWTSDAETSFVVLDAYTQAGGNSIDTADVYSAWAPGNAGGESETILGQWLAARGRTSGSGRDELVITTKVSQHPQFQGLSPENVSKAIDASLERLGLDHVDIYYAHFDDDTQSVADMAQAFSNVVEAGKARVIGLSNFSASRMREWLEYSSANGLTVPVILQQQYSLVERATFESDYAPIAKEFNLATESYYALASGFLTGKYRTLDDANANAARGSAVSKYVTSEGIALVDTMAEIASQTGSSITAVRLAWQIARGVTSPIASARVPEQLPAILEALQLNLTSDQVDALDKASAPFA